MRYRYRVRIGPGDVGRRVTVRYRTPDGQASDVVGILEEWGSASLVVRDRRGELVRLALSDLLAAKAVGEPAPRPEEPRGDPPEADPGGEGPPRDP